MTDEYPLVGSAGVGVRIDFEQYGAPISMGPEDARELAHDILRTLEDGETHD